MKSNLWIICTSKDYPLVYNCKDLIGACWPFFVCLFVCIHNLWCIFTIEYIQQLKRINEWYMQRHGCISKIFFIYVKEARHKNYVLYTSIFMDSRTNKTAQWWRTQKVVTYEVGRNTGKGHEKSFWGYGMFCILTKLIKLNT